MMFGLGMAFNTEKGEKGPAEINLTRSCLVSFRLAKSHKSLPQNTAVFPNLDQKSTPPHHHPLPTVDASDPNSNLVPCPSIS